MDVGVLSTALIGPNAITRIAEALRPGAARTVFRAAGLEARLLAPPDGMVPEREVTALHQALRMQFGEAVADDISRQAGRLTATYLLAARIPRLLQWLLQRLPDGAAARILAAAIGRHAWTFAGSGRFRVLPGWPMRLEVANGPIAQAGPATNPVCGYYAATFETLFRELVNPSTQVEEVDCEAAGALSCIFELRW
jgi:divinyl protochlorophyllide a 8-vinyl-reductase